MSEPSRSAPTPLPTIVPWYRIYGADVDTRWLADVIARHAAAVADGARALEEVRRAEEPPELLRFEASGPSGSAPVDGDDRADDDSADSSASLTVHVARAARRVFGVASLRPRQEAAVLRALTDEETRRKLLLVERTGGGKSLVLGLVSVLCAGVTVVLVPLLALTADQLARFNNADQSRGVVHAIHLDETDQSDLDGEVVPMLDDLPRDTSSTVLLLTSPQKLATEKRVRDALLRCAGRGTLRVVAIDEAHLYTMHGRTFRDSVRCLGDVFFRPLVAFRFIFLAMTATMSPDLLRDFSALTHVDWTDPRHQMWASASEFRQREIKMEVHTTGDITQHALKDVVELLVSDCDAHVCIFVNFKSEATKWTGMLEKLLSERPRKIEREGSSMLGFHLRTVSA